MNSNNNSTDNTDLVSYKPTDDHSEHWKDLKTFEYESTTAILKNYAKEFNENSSIGWRFKLNVENDRAEASNPFRSVRLTFVVKYGDDYEYYRDILNLSQNIETFFPITIENYLYSEENPETHSQKQIKKIMNCYSIEELKKALDAIIYSDHLKNLIINVATYYSYL